MKFAIIGGSNIETLPIPYQEEIISTPYGDVVLFRAKLSNGIEVLFRARHGVLTPYDPSFINYRANVYALYRIGVTHIIGLTSVGSCDPTFELGSLCLLSDYIDFTRQRPMCFEREHRKFLHAPMEDVFDPEISDMLEQRIQARNLPYAGRTVYACTEGPRFETASEVRMLRGFGAQVVGMTIVPEAPLARELGLSYSAIGVVANYCTGVSSIPVADENIAEVMADTRGDVFDVCFDLIRSFR